MVQGGAKLNKSKKVAANSAKAHKQVQRAKLVRKGSPTVAPRHNVSQETILDQRLSRAIDVANEQKVAAKLVQDGNRLSLTDIMQRGKELNRANKRTLVKRKVGRVEEKLNQLKSLAAAEEEGMDA